MTDEWYGTIKDIITRGIKRKHVPNPTFRPRAAKKFMASVAALMTQNLSDIAIRSLLMFTNFMCDYHVSIAEMLLFLNFSNFSLTYQNSCQVFYLPPTFSIVDDKCLY